MRLLSVQVKICQSPNVNFETTSQFLFKFCITFQCHERLLLCTFLAQTIYTMVKRSALFQDFLRLSITWVKICQFLMSIFKWESNFSPNFASLFSVVKDNSFVLSYLKQHILCLKGTHWNKNVWDFWVFGSKFNKFLMSILKWQKDPMKVTILRLSSALMKICYIPHVIFQTTS